MTGRATKALLLATLLWATNAGAAAYDVIVCGSGGEAEYEQRFAAWGQRLRRVLVEEMGHDADKVQLLSGASAGLDGIRRAFADVAARLDSADVLYVFLVGHGSYRDGVAKLNIPGPDLSAAALDSLLHRTAAARVGVVNAASASAAFIGALSGPGRAVCTSTRSPEQRNASVYPEHFVAALEDGGADGDRDGRVSFWEACRAGAERTAAWYAAEGRLATEHALLDDDGDGLGTRLDEAVGGGGDGAQAQTLYLRRWDWGSGVPEAWVEEYRLALERVEAWVEGKASVEPAAYQRRLEGLLIEAARLGRRLRQAASEAVP